MFEKIVRNFYMILAQIPLFTSKKYKNNEKKDPATAGSQNTI
jgi:hypothetical protein